MATILVVDDHHDNCQFLTKLLGYYNHQSIEANDGLEALEKLRAGTPDLIITDVLMPKMDGYELVRKLRDDPATAGIPVIFYTALYLAHAAQSLVKTYGVSCILTKPSKPQMIIKAVEDALKLPPGSVPDTPKIVHEQQHQIENTDHLLQETDHLELANRRLEALIELGHRLASEHEPQHLIELLCEEARKIIGARYAFIKIPSEEKPELRRFIASGIEVEDARQYLLPAARDLLDRVFADRVALRTSGDPVGQPKTFPPKSKISYNSLLGAPIITPTEFYGWLCLADKLGAQEFNEEEEQLGGTLAAQLAIAYENLERYTKLKHEMERRSDLQARLAGILDSAMEAIISIDEEQRIVLFNTAAEKMFLCPASEAMGQSLDRFIPERFRQAHRGHIVGFGRTNVSNRLMGVFRTVYGLRANGEEFPIESSISQLHTSKQKLYTVILRDMTERMLAEQRSRQFSEQMEARVRERTAQLEAANRELEAFSYSVAHDLRAPLRAVAGFSRILLDEHAANLDEDGLQLLQTITTSATQCGQLVADLLALSQLGRKELEKKEIDMMQLARSVATELQQREPDREINLMIQPLPPIHGDSSMLRQVFINLIENAFKFTRNCAHPAIEIGFRQENKETVYFVKDNGAGFGMQYYDKLFGVFQRLHNAEDFEGTGVGLAIVRRVIDRHDGRVWAEGREGAGATFYFTLPSG